MQIKRFFYGYKSKLYDTSHKLNRIDGTYLNLEFSQKRYLKP